MAECETGRTTSGLWVFGYGSLCWHPGFEYDRAVTGYVKGFSRKFWQGNTTHRGTDEQPGRVATLVDQKEGVVWGRAFEVHGEAALPYLNQRECKLGGYMTQFTTFHPRQAGLLPFSALLYIATPSNRHWLGDAPVDEIASQIVASSGRAGHNVEYLLRLVGFMRDAVPEETDEHLFCLEAAVVDRVRAMNMCMQTLMGETLVSEDRDEEVAEEEAEAAIQVNTFEYTARVAPKKLRCLNI